MIWCLSHCIILRGTWCWFVPILVISTSITFSPSGFNIHWFIISILFLLQKYKNLRMFNFFLVLSHGFLFYWIHSSFLLYNLMLKLFFYVLLIGPNHFLSTSFLSHVMKCSKRILLHTCPSLRTDCYPFECQPTYF